MAFKMDVTFKTLELKLLLANRGLEVKGRVQRVVDSDVIRLTDNYVPMDSGELKRSATNFTKLGSGEVRYVTPYARRQYYENAGKSGGLRGKMWFHRSKADNKKAILTSAIKEAGAKK